MLTTDTNRPIFADPLADAVADHLKETRGLIDERTIREERSGYCLPESYDGPSYVQGYPQ